MPDRRECVEIDRKDPRNFDAMDGENEKMQEQKYKEAIKGE